MNVYGYTLVSLFVLLLAGLLGLRKAYQRGHDAGFGCGYDAGRTRGYQDREWEYQMQENRRRAPNGRFRKVTP